MGLLRGRRILGGGVQCTFVQLPRQGQQAQALQREGCAQLRHGQLGTGRIVLRVEQVKRGCVLYTSEAADDMLCVDVGGCRHLKQTTKP